jgi:hypothetical protein
MVEKPISSFGVNLASTNGLVKNLLLQPVNARRAHPGNDREDTARCWLLRRMSNPEAL